MIVPGKRERLQRVMDAKFDMFDFIHRSHAALSKEADYAVNTDFVICVEVRHVYSPLVPLGGQT